MDIRIFNDIFVNKIIDKRKMIFVELFLIMSLLLMIIFFNNFYDYYSGKGEMVNKYLSTLVLIDDINIFKNNESMYINGKEYEYEINNIEKENYVSNGYIYKMVNIKIDNYEELDNNYVDFRIIKNKETLISYFINTLKGG